MKAALKRGILVLAWLAATFGLYAGLVGLEFYWNFPDWQPRLDVLATALLIWTTMMLFVFCGLCFVTQDRVTRTAALLMCFAMVALAIYLFPAEPVMPGLLGRESPSPLWYRSARLAVFSLPGALWAIGLRQRAQPY